MNCLINCDFQSNDSGGSALFYAGFHARKALVRSQAGVLTECCQMSSSLASLCVKFHHRVHFVRTGAEKIFSFSYVSYYLT
jgi:hypothetical protein